MKNTPILKTIFTNPKNLFESIQQLLQAGADPNETTDYSETPLRVSSRLGYFDIVKLLLDHGADASQLQWTPLFYALAHGNQQQVRHCVENGESLHARDTWERTPLLLAIQGGDINKVRYLLEAGADITETGRCEKPALEYAIQMDNAGMLAFLIDQGVNIEQYNPFGYTPLIQAADDGATNCVKTLLVKGANIHKTDRSQFSQKTAIAHTTSINIAKMLIEAGADLNQVGAEVRESLLKLKRQNKLTINKQQYLAQKHRLFGQANPQICDIPFWYDMVRCRLNAWQARDLFDDTDSTNDQPVWCDDRFGKSITALDNGEFIEIAGEHEDSYDPDFCIYNDIFHYKANGDLTIYQYPRDTFPPTDFHTATLVDGFIYIIGSLGYYNERIYGTTPVYRLDTTSFTIEKIETSGESPGWIHRHSATLENQSTIRLQGGEILEKSGEAETSRLNALDYQLDLKTLTWTKHEYRPKDGIFPCFPVEYKCFDNSDRTVLALEKNNSWQIIKILSVHRIDVTNGQTVRFKDETVTATSDDFLFVVAYAISTPFDSLDQLEKAVEAKQWKTESACEVCRTTVFPENTQYIGFEDISKAERKAFKAWKTLYYQDKAVIA